MPQLDALVFDAYGTLYDVHSVTAKAEGFFPGRGAQLSQLWRTKQLEYTWLRSLMGTYVNFNIVTADALRYACECLAPGATETQITALLDQYVHLDTFAEVKGALATLKAGRKLAILSNGAPDTLNALVKNAGLDTLLDATLSVDSIGVFKPDMRIYRMAEQTLGVPKARTGFVSSNCWDAIAAKQYGFTVFWINRLNAPVDRHGPQPDYIVKSLDDVLSRA